MSRETADRMTATQLPINARGGVVQLADGQETRLQGSIRIPVPSEKGTVWHRFRIMPTLGSEMLIGIDLWAKIGRAIPLPPSPDHENETPRAAAAEGLATRTETENRRLEEFLRRELREFESVNGPTDRTQHVIRTKDGVVRSNSDTGRETPPCRR